MHLSDETIPKRLVNSFAYQAKKIRNKEANLDKQGQPPLLSLLLQLQQERPVQLPREQQADPIWGVALVDK